MNKKRIVSLILAFILSASSFAFAGNGNGGGSESGDPVTLDSSSVVDGSTDVATDVDIVLTFSKNVVNMAVKDENAKHFSMKDSSGADVAITVSMGDDQVDPDIKRIITIEARGLKESETYTLLITKGLAAKNESSKLEEDVTITFTTEGTTQPADESNDDQNADDAVQETHEQGENSGEQQDEQSSADSKKLDSKSSIALVVLVIFVIAAVAAVVIVLGKKKKTEDK